MRLPVYVSRKTLKKVQGVRFFDTTKSIMALDKLMGGCIINYDDPENPLVEVYNELGVFHVPVGYWIIKEGKRITFLNNEDFQIMFD